MVSLLFGLGYSLIAVCDRRRSFRGTDTSLRRSYCAVSGSDCAFRGTHNDAAGLCTSDPDRRVGYGWSGYTAVETCDARNASWETSVSSGAATGYALVILWACWECIDAQAFSFILCRDPNSPD